MFPALEAGLCELSFLQQTSAVRMKLDGSNIRVGIAIGDDLRLPSWRRTAVENVRAVADQRRDEL